MPIIYRPASERRLSGAEAAAVLAQARATSAATSAAAKGDAPPLPPPRANKPVALLQQQEQLQQLPSSVAIEILIHGEAFPMVVTGAEMIGWLQVSVLLRQ
jgi:hypothetical protein